VSGAGREKRWVAGRTNARGRRQQEVVVGRVGLRDLDAESSGDRGEDRAQLLEQARAQVSVDETMDFWCRRRLRAMREQARAPAW